VRALTAVSANPSYLNTRNPNVHSIRDFTDSDRISVAAVRASQVAILLEMAAEQAFGPGQFGRLDPLTVTMPQPESVATMLAERSEVTAHFTVAPFHQAEIRDPRIHTVLRSTDVLGGIGTVVVAYTTARFREQNPRMTAALFAALVEAGEFIHSQPRRAAEIYLQMSHDRLTVDELTQLLQDPDYSYQATPRRTLLFAEFMHRTGVLPRAPERWQDLFFPEAHALDGN
jgi:NitT/TauT family transport system substrate-binding protein